MVHLQAFVAANSLADRRKTDVQPNSALERTSAR
jgi:hypothetical protein